MVDVGTDDPFRAADTALAQKTGAKLHVWPGAHDGGYWNRHMAQYLRFYADAVDAYKGSLNYRWLKGRLFGFAIQLIYGFIAFLGVVSWLRDRSRRVLFWMSAWACALLLSSFFTSLRLPFTSAFSNSIQQPLLSG